MGSRDRYKELLLYSPTHSTQDTERLPKPADFFRKQHDHTAANTYAGFVPAATLFAFLAPISLTCAPAGGNILLDVVLVGPLARLLFFALTFFCLLPCLIYSEIAVTFEKQGDI